MPSVHQLRGVLLEEAILTLLRAGGYRTVSEVGDDPKLSISGAGLRVRGRGAHHQIDAIADLRIGQPFSNPQRLLVEAKCYSDERLTRMSHRGSLRREDWGGEWFEEAISGKRKKQ
jgi:hypothetical protein